MLETNEIQLSCIADLVFIAFLECLNHRETTISLAQLHTRNFSPHKQLTRDCICFLYKQGRVGLSHTEKRRHGKKFIGDVNISVRNGRDDIPKHIIHLSYTMRAKLIETSIEPLLERLIDELKIYECIEYCRFYLSKEGLDLRNDITKPYKLHLMVIELAQEQVCMLTWRAVKSASNSTKNRKSVTLNELCDLAYKYLLDYRKRKIEIDYYRIPFSVGSSTLRDVICKYSVPTIEDLNEI